MRGHWLDTYNKMTRRDVSPLLLHMACTMEIIHWIEEVLPEVGRSRRFRYNKPVDIRNDLGETALHLAAEEGNEAMVLLVVADLSTIKRLASA